ncbi:MAG: peptidylprolyl isomerase [Candidatus Binatia bacterium]
MIPPPDAAASSAATTLAMEIKMSSLATTGGRAGRAVCTFTMAGTMAVLAGCQDGPAKDGAAVPATQSKPVATAKAPAGSGTELATYDGKTFTVEDFRAAVGGLNARARKSLDESPDRRKQFIENHIVSKLIFEEGVERGFDKSPEIQRRLEELKEHLVVQQVMEEQQNATVSDADVQAYYDTHTAEFSTEKVKASHILVDNEALAKEIVAKLGTDKSQFAALAAEHSKDLSNAKRGGDLGMFGRGRMVKEFEDAAFALAADGDISAPIQTRFGWHIIMRTGREQGSVQPFDQVKSQIKVKLVSESRREKTTGFIDELKQKAGLTINEKALAEATLGDAAAADDADTKKKDKPSGH